MSPLKGQTRSRGQTGVYRLRDGAGDLLYVGSSSNPQARYYEHAWIKPWWPEVASKDVTWYDTRADAEAAEKVAVAEEGPRYNVVHTSLHRKVSAFKEAMTDDELAFWASTSNSAAGQAARLREKRGEQ